MTTARETDRGGAPLLRRALTAVVALYALVLQSLLGSIAALPAAFDPAAQVRCLQQDAAAPDRPQDSSHHHPPGCCTAAHHPDTGAAPPLPAPAALTWPPQAASRVVLRMAGHAAGRAPPNARPGARAPPVV